MLSKTTSKSGKPYCEDSFRTDIYDVFAKRIINDRYKCVCGKSVKLKRHPIHKGLFQIPRHCKEVAK